MTAPEDFVSAARTAAVGFARSTNMFYLVDEFESEALFALPALMRAHDPSRCSTAAWAVGPLKRHLRRQWGKRRTPPRDRKGACHRRFPSGPNADPSDVASTIIDPSWRLGFDLVDEGPPPPPPLLGRTVTPPAEKTAECCIKNVHTCKFCPECGRPLRGNVFLNMLSHCLKEAARAEGMAKTGRVRGGRKNYDPKASAEKWKSYADACRRALDAGIK